MQCGLYGYVLNQRSQIGEWEKERLDGGKIAGAFKMLRLCSEGTLKMAGH
ncbi:hypothetical protein CsSME_00050150 [Camellia sinensis var. sinensis]